MMMGSRWRDKPRLSIMIMPTLMAISLLEGSTFRRGVAVAVVVVVVVVIAVVVVGSWS